jgi:dihydropteroate synthase
LFERAFHRAAKVADHIAIVRTLRSMNASDGTTWRLGDRLYTPRFPLVMGIINATTDSFHPASRAASVDDALHLAERMLVQGADILDIGGQSSRPGSGEGDEREEKRRVIPVIEAIHREFPEALISVDTWRAAVAAEAVAFGARMVNDIGAGLLDAEMLRTVAGLGVPYVAMHMQATPATMQRSPQYGDVTKEVTLFLSGRLRAARCDHRPGLRLRKDHGTQLHPAA